jgi:hypothetical protein
MTAAIVNDEQLETRTADSAVRSMIARVMGESRMSRAEIAERMTLQLGRRITKAMLNDCSAETKKLRFPASWVRAFCCVTNDDRLQRLLLGPRLLALLEFAERELSAARDEAERRQLRKRLIAEHKK